MINQELAKIFYEIANILEFKDIQWKPQAYRKAARTLENLQQPVTEIYKKGSLKALDELPGIGKNISKKIEEYIKTKNIKEYQKLKKQTPFNLQKLMDISSLGPKRIKTLYQKLKIRNIQDLKKAIQQHKIQKLPGFKEKLEKDIQEGIKLTRKKRMLLSEALDLSNYIIQKLKPFTLKISPAGSLRRMDETIGDIDLLATSKQPQKLMQIFTSLPEIKKILAKGPTKSIIVLKNNLQIDIRVVPNDCYGSALQYFTGNKQHNITLRKIAIKKHYKLSEYGLFHKNKRIATTEKEIYSKLNIPYSEPEIRENKYEFQKFPKLISLQDIKGDLHIHTNYSDGSSTIQELIQKAKSLNYQYIAITDHSKSRKISRGLSIKQLQKQIKEINKINSFKILKGAEVDILRNGSLDYPNSILKQLDIVIAAVHSSFKLSKIEQTNRILKALQNKHVNILAHPTGRLIQKRNPYQLDLQKIYEFAKDNNKLLEINSYPQRLDLNATNIKEALQNKVKLVISTDAHSTQDLNYMSLGVSQAKKALATPKDIVNTLNYKQLRKFIKD